MPLYRAQQTNVYHTCSRCGTRQPLSQMKWQNGLLICQANDCKDTAIVGSRDLNVARAVATDRKELQPDEKLVNPADRRADELEVLY